MRFCPLLQLQALDFPQHGEMRYSQQAHQDPPKPVQKFINQVYIGGYIINILMPMECLIICKIPFQIALFRLDSCKIPTKTRPMQTDSQ